MVTPPVDAVTGAPAAVITHHRLDSVPFSSGTWTVIVVALAVVCVFGLQLRSLGTTYSWLKAYWSLGLSPDSRPDERPATELVTGHPMPLATAVRFEAETAADVPLASEARA